MSGKLGKLGSKDGIIKKENDKSMHKLHTKGKSSTKNAESPIFEYSPSDTIKTPSMKKLFQFNALSEVLKQLYDIVNTQKREIAELKFTISVKYKLFHQKSGSTLEKYFRV